MGFVLGPRDIHCISCHYEGPSSLRGPGRGSAILATSVLAGSILYWPLLLAAVPFFLWLLCTPTCHVCPRCGWRYPVPVDVHEAQKKLAPLCSCCRDAPIHHDQVRPSGDDPSKTAVRPH